jgi:hypothetical protein
MLIRNLTGIPWNEVLSTASRQAYDSGDRLAFMKDPMTLGDAMYAMLGSMVTPILLEDYPEARESSQGMMDVVPNMLSPDGVAEWNDK